MRYRDFIPADIHRCTPLILFICAWLQSTLLRLGILSFTPLNRSFAWTVRHFFDGRQLAPSYSCSAFIPAQSLIRFEPIACGRLQLQIQSETIGRRSLNWRTYRSFINVRSFGAMVYFSVNWWRSFQIFASFSVRCDSIVILGNEGIVTEWCFVGLFWRFEASVCFFVVIFLFLDNIGLLV